MRKNSLLAYGNLPAFSTFEAEEIESAITTLINDSKAVIAQVVAENADSWQTLIVPIEEVQECLEQLWSTVSHMNMVCDSPALRQAYNSCLPLLTDFHTWCGQHVGLYAAYQRLRAPENFATLDAVQQVIVDQALRDFHLLGVDLSADKKARFARLQSSLSILSNRFSENVLDATQAWSKLVEVRDLSGLPDSIVAAAKVAAQAKKEKGYRLTLDFPGYHAVMTYADNAKLREEMYRAYTTRASDQGPNACAFDNTRIIEEILDLRQQEAELLGYKNYAELSLVNKMADSVEQVLEFLYALAKKSRSAAEKELAELKTFVGQKYGIKKLHTWDILYYSEKLRKERYQVTEETLRPYFPVDAVLSGLFEVARRLFGIRFEEVTEFDRWEHEVRLFTLLSHADQPIAAFYLDLYTRENKRSGAWMDEFRTRRLRPDGSVQLPVACLVCNIAPSVDAYPALLTHDEVITLFHEFGHGLHHMLSTVNYPQASGIHGVEWDAVELPSQFMENWCWEKEALDFISSHYKTGQPLPATELDKLLAARNFQSALALLRQIEFSLFDFKLHMHAKVDVQSLLDNIREEIAVIQTPAFNRFQHSFLHIFAGGYAAGYYSYKWAEVLSADAFATFEKEGIFNAETGMRFLREILAVGGSREAMASFVAFKGRPPELDALLRQTGIKELGHG